MSETGLALRRADDGALSYVERLLEENGLPSRDVREKPECFYVGSVADGAARADSDDSDDADSDDADSDDADSDNRVDRDRVGVGGLEIYDSVGLLRSIAVERSARGNGFGTAICEGLEARAREDGVETLYLLTTTAADFFADRGYATVDRADAPAAIQGTAEFDDLCPATATCMRKSL